MTAKYPEITVIYKNTDTPLQILSKAQNALLASVRAGNTVLLDDPRAVAFAICGMPTPTKREFAYGVPPSIYQALTVEGVVTNIKEWANIELEV